MAEILEGTFSAKGLRFGIVVSRFNNFFSNKLLEGARDCLRRHGAAGADITVAWVPGAFEIPMASKRMASSEKYDAVIAIGAVIRGNTPHFEYIASEVAKGLAATSLDSKVPISFGVLTTDTIEQAVERSGAKAGNKGFDAALAAIEMANLYKVI